MASTKLFKCIQRFVPPFLPTIIIAGCILYLSLSSFPDVPDTPLFHFEHIDKVVHFCMYFGLTLVLYFDWSRYKMTNPEIHIRHTWILWILPVLLGGLMEIAQKYLTATRSCDFIDFLANTAGATTGIILGIYLITPWIKRALTK